MKKYAIISDSSCNLNSKEIAELGIYDILPMHLYAGEEEFLADGDWKHLDAHEYYERMRNGVRIRSSQIIETEFEQVFRKCLNEGLDVLYLGCSSGLSKSVHEAIICAEKLQKEFPGSKVVAYDTLNCVGSLALVLIDACKMREEGKQIEDIISYLEANKFYYNEVGTVDKLTYLKQAGRVSASAAFFGGIFSIKPIVVYDLEGHNVAVEKTKGRTKSLELCADYVKRYGKLDQNNVVYICHADCLDDAKKTSEFIQARFPDIKIDFRFAYIEPGVGSATGPGTIIIDFYGSDEIRKLNK